ncbi:MAG: Lrp/AsnC family transcriptional regulator [Hyphomonadaceae bacterium]
MAMEMDERDQRIAAALEADAWLTYAALGQRVHLSASAVQRRVERMIADGIILGARAEIAPTARGRPLRLFALVELRDESASSLDAFAKKLAKEPDVIEAHYVAGPSDVIIVLQCASMEEYAAFAAKHLNGSPLVRRYKTLTSLRTFR